MLGPPVLSGSASSVITSATRSFRLSKPECFVLTFHICALVNHCCSVSIAIPLISFFQYAILPTRSALGWDSLHFLLLHQPLPRQPLPRRRSSPARMQAMCCPSTYQAIRYRPHPRITACRQSHAVSTYDHGSIRVHGRPHA